jgi:hypothetical protein
VGSEGLDKVGLETFMSRSAAQFDRPPSTALLCVFRMTVPLALYDLAVCSRTSGQPAEAKPKLRLQPRRPESKFILSTGTPSSTDAEIESPFETRATGNAADTGTTIRGKASRSSGWDICSGRMS